MSNQGSDVIVIGGGIIGVSLALELRRRGASVRVLERGEPGHEASWAGAGMLAARDPDTPECLRQLALASAQMYPEWIAELEEETGLSADLRRDGTLYLSGLKKELGAELGSERLSALEPDVSPTAPFVYFSDEGSVDPRALMAMAVTAAKKRGIVISHEHRVTGLDIQNDRASGVQMGNNFLAANVIVNCAGAWAGEIAGVTIPSHPVKGQMLSVVPTHHGGPPVKHVIRGDEVYLVPRSDGRILIGATVEDAGFDKRVEPETILRMYRAAVELVPKMGEMRIHESWAGLRPGSPDTLPILGATAVKGYFAATGHYRNGILLAPITAQVMADVINGDSLEFDMRPFDPQRFA